MVLKETNYNNYIVLIEKYLETTWFDGSVVETSKRRIILCYRIHWVQPKSPAITPAGIWGAKFLALMGCFQLPMGH